MRHNLARQQIYEMIWERAVSKVAHELGASDAALRKQYVKHAIADSQRKSCVAREVVFESNGKSALR